MAAMRTCLVALVVALGFLFLERPATAAAETTAEMSAERRQEVQSLLRRLNKTPLATIQSPDGDIIDCVHVSKQPAFDHPLLKNHTIQMRPSYHPRSLNQNYNITTNPITQTWHQNGKCPENTIPIRRTMVEDVLRASSISRYGKKRPRSIPNLNSISGPDTPNVLNGHKHAVAAAQDNKCYGTKASFNLWQPTIARTNDFSLSQLWVTAGSYSGNDLNTIEAGWQVYPAMYGDSNTRLFIYWTRDAYEHTGCYNLGCPGFVQTNNQIAIGGSLSPISTYGGTQYDLDILVWKDAPSGNWWLQVGGNDVGYWPSSIFSYLQDSASSVEWGGEVFSPDAGQTSTQMGSGHFPNEGFGKASHIKNMLVVDSSNTLRLPSGVNLLAEQSNCYNVQSGTSVDWGTYIYFGGPGKNPNCP
ncbi:unnamed protein product [Miscanthus lutarioriparius]|uniref:Neprosin PEP catalytic domain-containing protein n=1 Tax=Miscanthus lutarioriparius TaxID=422564 RepID=A0A811Q8I6_9POAL|nr:unnamed protein product [Miscanthus lutarioriparius]